VSQTLSQAHDRGWNLVTTLMVAVLVFKAGDGEFGVMPAAEYDGDAAAIVHEIDPYEP
jgi:hypothetical protein